MSNLAPPHVAHRWKISRNHTRGHNAALCKQLGQNFVVENRGGAGTTLGSGMAAKADPDGYTLLVNSTSHVVVASTYAKLPFNAAPSLL